MSQVCYECGRETPLGQPLGHYIGCQCGIAVSVFDPTRPPRSYADAERSGKATTHPTDAAIAQAFREYDEGDIVQLRMILARARELDAEKGGGNTGHGHVWPRPDGVKMRCGGPGLCCACSMDAARYRATPPAQAAEAVERVALVAEWTNDCCGKQDYDAELVSLSSRYYPAGGGMLVFDTRTGDWLKPNTAGIPPSAVASIYIQEERVATQEFSGANEAEVKAKVEAWAADKFDLIARAAIAAMQAGDGNK